MPLLRARHSIRWQGIRQLVWFDALELFTAYGILKIGETSPPRTYNAKLEAFII